MNLDWSILQWIQSERTCPVLDVLMPKITLLGNGGMIWLLASGGLLCTKKYRKQGILLLGSLAIGATVLTKTNRRFGYAAIPLAALIAFSRLYLYVHFPSDVLAAAVLGIGIGEVSVRKGIPIVNWVEQIWKEKAAH